MLENIFRRLFMYGARVIMLPALLVLVSHILVGGCGPSGDWGSDKRVYVTATDATAGEVGGDLGTFTIKLTKASPNTVTVTYTVSGTASPNVDYTGLSGTVTFVPGQTTAGVLVVPIDDLIVEADETVTITLGVVADYETSTKPATVTITSDDVATVSVDATTETTTEGSGSPGIFTVTLDAATQGTTIYYTISGTATPDNDYEALLGELFIPNGSTTGIIAVNPLNYDTIVEPSETVIVTLAADPAYTLGATTTDTVSIIDDDAPIATITATSVTAVEGGTQGEFTVSLSYDAGVDTIVNVSLTGEAIEGTDYTAIGTTVTVPTGSTSQTVLVDPIDDADIEGFETVIATIAAPAADEYVVGVPNTATVTIESDEKPTATIAALPTTIQEATEDTTTFTISIDQALSSDLDIYYSVSTDSATRGIDYDDADLTGIATITPGQTFIDIAVAAILDYDDSEGDEDVTVTVTAGSGYTVGAPSSATVTIQDYTVPEVTIAATTPIATEAGPVSGVFTVTLATAAIEDLTIAYEVVPASTASEDSDYTALAGTIVIPALAVSGTINIDPVDDLDIEVDETVIITLSTPADQTYKLGSTTTDTVIIQSND